MIAINARISDELGYSLAAVAEFMERSKSYLIGKAIEQYLKERVEDMEDARLALVSFKDHDQKFYSSEEVDKILAERLTREGVGT